MEVNDLDWTSYTRSCPECDNPLEKEVLLCSENVKYKCTVCDFTQTIKKVFVCSKCNIGILKFQEEKVIEKEDEDISLFIYTCDACNRTFKYDELIDIF